MSKKKKLLIGITILFILHLILESIGPKTPYLFSYLDLEAWKYMLELKLEF